MSFYTTAQRKAFVRAALAWLERYESSASGGCYFDDTAREYRRRIDEVTPKGRDPLDWSTEP